MPNTLKIKRGTNATIPQGQLAEPLFTTDTYDLYIGKGSGGNQRFQKYIASGTSSQFLKGDGTLDSTTYQATSEKGANNGYASLDSGGKVPASQLPNSIMDYLGTWNASTNTPTLADGTGNAGDVYIVSVGGTQNLGSGSITFAAGDWVVYSGSVWQKSINSNAVASVNGQTGAVVLTLNGLTNVTQTFATGTTGTDFTISSSGSTHNFNIPSASATSRGLLTSGDYNTFAGKQSAITLTTTGTSGAATFVASTLNIPNYTLAGLGGQPQLNGTGFVKATGTTISYDNSTYLPTSGGTVTSLSITTLTGSVYADATGALGTTQGTANTIAYWGSSYSLASLPLTTYPSLTELSYVKGVTSAIQTQLNSKQATISLTTSGTSGAATFSSNTLNIPNYSTIYSADGTLSGNRTVTAGTNTLTFSSSRTSGTPFSFNSTQTAANASDLGDGTMAVNHTITGSTGTELVIRAMSFGITNGMSGGTVTNYRGWNVASNTSAGSTTTNLDQIFIEAGAYSGTVTSSRAIRINNMLGTNRAAIAINALGGLNNNVYLLLGDTTIPTGNWGIYQSESSYSNYLNGNTSIGTTAGGFMLNVAGTGKFSGALTGTSATFSSSVTANNLILTAGTLFAAGNTGFSNRLSDTTLYLQMPASGFNITDNALNTKVQISSTGAATFSSSVTANGNLFVSNSTADNNSATILNTSATGYGLRVSGGQSGDNSTRYAFRVSDYQNNPLFSVYGGGNVGIGTTSPSNALDVSAGTAGSSGRIRLLHATSSASLQMYVGVSDGTGFIVNNNPLWFEVNGTERMRITSGGVVLVNQTSTSAASAGQKMQIATDVLSTGSLAGYFWENRSGGVTYNSNWYGWYTTSGTIYLYNGSANVASINPSTGAYTALSDISKKKDFEASTIGLDAILGLKPTLYRMKTDDENSQKQLGFIAQEVKEFIPQAYIQTKGEKEDFIGLDDRPIIAAMVKAIQELKAELDILKNK